MTKFFTKGQKNTIYIDQYFVWNGVIFATPKAPFTTSS